MLSEKEYWFALSKCDEIGPARIKKLYDHFGSSTKIANASFKELIEVDGIGDFTASSIVRCISQNINKINIPDSNDISFVTLSENNYPELLKNIYDPPPIIYLKGSLLEKDSLAIAVVGTRRSTRYGEEMTKVLVKGMVDAGITVVSGLALGIDACAHRAALDNGGRTFAVLGCGLNNIYPFQNKRLAEDIERNGALISEFEIDAPPEIWNFPRRNRIISGLSLGTVVVEGSNDSGSLITARFALDQNREVFAVPGQAGNELSKGPHSLIKQGAKLVEGLDDILEELHIYVGKRNKANNEIDISKLTESEQALFKLISDQPEHIDILSLKSQMTPGQISSVLLELVFKGIIKELTGKYYVRG